jgi:hypothetical protein
MLNLDFTWIVPLRWPLAGALALLAVVLWRRRPERNRPWHPPDSAANDRAPPCGGPHAPTDPPACGD